MGTHADNMMHMEMQMRHDHSPPSSSSRILDIPCKVCGDFSSGKHYNIFACDGCAGFFKRSIRRNREYVCKAKEEGTCVVDKTHRNQCRACRLTKCHQAGMNKDAVQHERGPRNSTLRRQQLAHFMDPRDRIMGSSGSVLDLAMPKPGSIPSTIEQNIPMSPAFTYNSGALGTAGPQISPIHLSPAPILHPMLQPAAICESAARLLFMNVQWTRNVPSFTSLPLEDQLILLEESWRELFILGASQFLMLDLTSLVQACGFIERQPELAVSFLQDVRLFQETLAKIAEFRLDPHEYACLRAIVLFKSNFDKSPRGLSDVTGISAIHEHTQLTLNKYITTVHPGQPLRFGKLLMLLPTLHNVPGYIIEELFFRQSIGPIPIVRIICDMYKSPKPDVL